MHDIISLADEIGRRFRPRQILLFGSYAYGQPGKDSDVDLLILIDGKHVHDRAITIRRAIDFDFPVDLLVRSPAEFEERIGLGDFFLKEIQDKGKLLYEAPGARMGEESRRRFQHRAARTSSQKVPNYDSACFHAQQCIEKYFKARLQESAVVFPYTHDLEALLKLAL